MDIDAFEERAAIMEYDGGLSRFRAETLAARAQGFERHEAIRIRDSQQARDHREATTRHGQNDMPRVQRRQAEEKGPLPVGQLLGGWGGLALLALFELGGRMV
ncbi:hypothetical protein [Ruegeria jejuensis]|uniref:hypothetical protein n=1 Tax=Ruegeria jejuensis TaxID=3233338 RepID=UPI00355BC4DB